MKAEHVTLHKIFDLIPFNFDHPEKKNIPIIIEKFISTTNSPQTKRTHEHFNKRN